MFKSVETFLQEQPGRYFSVLEIEVYTGLCRRAITRRLVELVADNQVETRRVKNRLEYRWIDSSAIGISAKTCR